MKHTKLPSLLLAVVLTLALVTPAFATGSELNYPITEGSTAKEAADYLYTLGLFNGTGTKEDGTPIYELDAIPTRAQGVTMLVRLIGKEAEAKETPWDASFTDVPDWAKPYVGYAYANKLTTGRDETTFDPDTPISASEYLTLVLRALGYTSKSDFLWDSAWTLTNKLGITTTGTYEVAARTFTRGDIALVSGRAMSASLKGESTTLLKSLLEKGAVQQVYYAETVLTSAYNELYLAIAPTFASPETYTSFVVNSVTANGVTCTIQQYSTPKEVAEYLDKAGAAISTGLVPEGTFAMMGLKYDEKAASDAATRFYTDDFGEGETFDYPIIDFKFTCTATLADGTKVEETFTRSFHMDAYDGPLSWF